MFFEQIISLCEMRGKKLTPVVTGLGFSKGNIERWRKGILPTGDTLLKFAEYFNVSTDYLLTGKNPPMQVIKNDKDDTQMENLINGDITNSAVTQANTATTTNGTTQNISDEKSELLRIFDSLNLKGRTQLLSLAYNLEDTHV